MSSWGIQAPRKRIGTDALVFVATEAGFCSQFNNYLFHVILAKKQKQKLYLVDQYSALRYSFLQRSFLLPSIVEPLSILPVKVQSSAKQILAVLSNMSHEQIRAEAAQLFRLSPELSQQIAAERANYAFPSFDVGVHIRSGDKITTGEMRTIPLEKYAAEIRSFAPKSVFVMTDTPGLRDTLKSILEPKIQVYGLEFKSPCSTHIQGEFNLAARGVKEAAYVQFMTELNIMQEIPAIVCTLSSNVGRYLYVTRKSVSGLKSLDVPVYTPV
jgi:hypothetical protein